MRPALVAFGILLAASTGRAQSEGRLGFLTRQLNRANDPRVRAQAALLLAASKETAAVASLCHALEDRSDLVRSASARALGELGEGAAISCLKGREAAEGVPEVRAEIARALDGLEKDASRLGALYIVLAPISDKGASLHPDLLRLAEERLRSRVSSMGGLLAAPEDGKRAGAAAMRGKKRKGYYVRVELEGTPNGGLKMNLICFTHPGRSLLGEINVKASGAQTEDLIRALAPKAIEEAAQTFDWSS